MRGWDVRMDHHWLEGRRSAPGAALPENRGDEEFCEELLLGMLLQAASLASSVWMAASSFLRAPNAAIPSSIKFSSVSVVNTSKSISLSTKISERRISWSVGAELHDDLSDYAFHIVIWYGGQHKTKLRCTGKTKNTQHYLLFLGDNHIKKSKIKHYQRRTL